jgi:anti-sigma regulatory factor (Ser/Thr protein kinase)
MAIVVLLAMKQAFLFHRKNLVIIPPDKESNPKSYSHCLESGLLNEFGIGPAPLPNPKSAMVPGVFFSGLGAEWPILALARRFSSLKEDDEDLLRTALHELMMNIKDHSRSSYGGALAARVHPDCQELRVAIVDSGIGIRRSLSGIFQLNSDKDAIHHALQEGVTSRSQRRNMGMGLNSIHQIATANGGALVLISGKAALRANHRLFWKELPYAFPGTLALLKFVLSDYKGDKP